MLNKNWSDEQEKRYVGELNSLKEVETEIRKTRNELRNYKRSLYWVVPTIFIISLILPFLNGKNDLKPLIESIGYIEGVGFGLLVFSAIFVYSFFQLKRKGEEKLSNLQSRKRTLEKRK